MSHLYENEDYLMQLADQYAAEDAARQKEIDQLCQQIALVPDSQVRTILLKIVDLTL